MGKRKRGGSTQGITITNRKKIVFLPYTFLPQSRKHKRAGIVFAQRCALRTVAKSSCRGFPTRSTSKRGRVVFSFLVFLPLNLWWRRWSRAQLLTLPRVTGCLFNAMINWWSWRATRESGSTIPISRNKPRKWLSPTTMSTMLQVNLCCLLRGHRGGTCFSKDAPTNPSLWYTNLVWPNLSIVQEQWQCHRWKLWAACQADQAGSVQGRGNQQDFPIDPC